MITDLDAREEVLAAVAREAGDLARTLFLSPESLGVKMKGKQDFITLADGEVERMIASRLKAHFPNDAFLGEEGGVQGGDARKAEAIWIVDPIDGTANFAYGVPHFCVSIGLVSGGQPVLGAIAAPMYDEMYLARRGRGAFRNGKPIRVSENIGMGQAVIELGWSSRRPVRAYTGLLERVLATGATFRRAGSGALGLAYVADGRNHGYCELHINSWDVAAALLVVQEAGGWTSDFFAGEGLLEGNPVLACAPQLKEALVAATGVGQVNEKPERRIS